MKKIKREDLTNELLGAVEIDESLLGDVTGGDHCDDDGGGGGDPIWTTPATSCVPPGTSCP